MSKSIMIASLMLVALTGGTGAQGDRPGDRALGSELARDKAETRIDRLRQDQRQNEQRPQPRAQKLPGDNPTQQQQRR